jgi:hypothetical protein
LLLRCLVITLLACILAAPLWQQQLIQKKAKGWVLLEKENLREGYSKNQVKIDSLLRSGYEFHYLDEGFEKDELTKALGRQNDTFAPNPSNYWTAIKELNKVVPSDVPIAIFVTNKLNRYSGQRPQVSLNLTLHTYQSSDSTSAWITKAFLTPSDSIHIIVGHSTPLRNYYTQHNTSLKAINHDQFKIEVSGGKLAVSLKNDKATAAIDTSVVEVDTSTTRIGIFSDKFRNDANYLIAAFESIKRFSNRKLKVTTTSNLNDIAANPNWLIWLSDQNIPDNLVANNILKYEVGKVENRATWVNAMDETSNSQEQTTIAKTVSSKNPNTTFETIWRDGFGSPLLLKEVKGNTSVYHFYSHFDPEWNDLPWSEEFPQLIFNLLFAQETYEPGVHDKRIIDQKQLQPIVLSESQATAKEQFVKKTDLSFYFWLGAFVLFFIERFISFRNKKMMSNG